MVLSALPRDLQTPQLQPTWLKTACLRQTPTAGRPRRTSWARRSVG